MNKLLAALIATLFAAGAFAQAPASKAEVKASKPGSSAANKPGSSAGGQADKPAMPAKAEKKAEKAADKPPANKQELTRPASKAEVKASKPGSSAANKPGSSAGTPVAPK